MIREERGRLVLRCQACQHRGCSRAGRGVLCGPALEDRPAETRQRRREGSEALRDMARRRGWTRREVRRSWGRVVTIDVCLICDESWKLFANVTW